MSNRCRIPRFGHRFWLWVPLLIFVLFWQPVVVSSQDLINKAGQLQKQQHLNQEVDLQGSLLRTAEDDDNDNNIPQECFNGTQQHRYNSLTCWFYNLRVDIPQQSFTSHWITVKLQDLVCTNFSLQILNSHYHPTTTTEGPSTLALGLANLSATCGGKYKSTGFSGHMKATIAATAAVTPDNSSIVWLNDEEDATSDNPIRILWTLQSDAASNPLGLLQPSSFNVTSCRSNIAVPSLKFYGSASADVIDWFRHSIKSYVQEQVSQQFCPAFTTVLDPLLNQYLARTVMFLNQHLKPLLPCGTNPLHKNSIAAVKDRTTKRASRESRMLSAQPAEDDPEPHVRPAVRWSTDAPLLATSLRALNHFIDVHLQEGFLPRWFPSLKRLNLKTCGFFFHGINGVIRALLDLQEDQPDDNDDECPPAALDSEVWYSLPLPPRLHTMIFTWPEMAALDLNISEIAISGLDRWSDLSLFRLDSDHDFFETRLKTDDPVRIQIQASLNVSAAPGNNSSSILSGGDLNEEFTIDLALDRLDWNTTLALWVDKQLWETKVTTGVLLDVLQGMLPASMSNSSYVVPQEALQCLLQSILDFSAPELSLGTLLRSLSIVPKTPINPDRPALMTESLEQDLDDLFNNALQMLIEEYPAYISSSMAGLVDGPVRHSFNDFLKSVTVPQEGQNDTCPTPDDDETTPPHLLNFSQVQPLQQLQEFLAHPKTLRRMNAYIQCTTDYVAHILSGVSLLPVSVEGTSLTLTNASFANIGQIVSLKLLEADEDGLRLSNSLVYGSDEDDSSPNLPHLVLQLALELPTGISAAANITLLWNDLSLAGSSVLHYNVNQLKSYGLARVFQHGHCLLAPIDEFQASVVTTGDNDGNGLLGLFNAVVNASVTLPGTNHSNSTTLEYGLSTQDYPTIHGLAEAILEWTLDSGRDFLNLASIYSLSQASQLCSGGSARVPTDNRQQNDDFNSEEVWSMALILTTMVLLAQPAILMLRKSSNDTEDRHGDNIQHTMSSTLTQPLLDPGMGNDEDDLVMINNRIRQARQPQPEGLVDSSHIPALARVCLPMMMIATLFLLLSSNLSVGASVELTATLPHNRTLELPALFEFSLIQTARDMWNAKIYAVFFLIVVFSGLWPYAKLVIMLYCFVSRNVQESTRGAYLLALDALSKFSLVDTYVLVLMMVAFRYHLQFSQNDGNGEPNATMGLDVVVVPQFGFYGFLLATTLSLVAGHAAVYYHRMTQLSLSTTKTEEGSQEPQATPDTCPRQPLLCHAYQSLPQQQNSPCTSRRGKRLSRLAQFFLLLLWLAAVVLLGIGMTQKSFIFEFGGLAGVALGDEEARRSAYSLISLGTSIPASGDDGWGLHMLMVAYFFYAVAAPFACLYFLFLLFVLPLSVPWQWRLLQWAEIANAWSAVEVFCLSIVASLLEISSFAEFILGDRCDTINQLVQNYWPDSDDDNMGDAKCFTVHSSVDWHTAVFLIMGALLNSWIVSVSLRLVHAAMDDRLHEEGWIPGGPSEASQPPQQQPDVLSDASSSDEHRLINIAGILPWFFVSESDHEDEEHGHEPAHNEADSQASPWQQRDGFVREWESDAERDPQWKEWKDSQSQPSSAAGGEDGSAPQEREPSAASQ